MLPTGTLRLIDANANRAREGIRTIEDVARFILGDIALAARARHARHGLAGALPQAGLDAAMLARHRDTAGDVGATPTTGAHAAPLHENVQAMVIAAGHRAAEALRVLAEATRLEEATAAASPAFERLRYAVYDLQRDVLAALEGALAAGNKPRTAAPAAVAVAAEASQSRRPCPQFKLCVLLTESMCRGPWLDVAKAAIDGGADCLQLREKGLDDAELLARAESLSALCDGSGVACFINDRVDIALLAGADGVHLGQDDISPQRHRQLAGWNLWLGVSTHNLDEAAGAIEGGADVCGVGAMFSTQTKPRETSGPAYLREYITFAAPRGNVPHLAIGGITPANIGELAIAGCKGVAVSSVVCYAPDPAAVCRELLAALR